jgi:hypothetical protein
VTETLIQWLGVKIPEGAEAHFEWGHLPRGESGLLAVACLASLVLLTVWLYRREGRAGAWRKGLLAGLRLVVFAAVTLVLLEPRLAIDVKETSHGFTVVLWDASLSMSVADPYQDEARRRALSQAAGLQTDADVAALSRHELAWRIVERAKLVEGLAARNQVLVYAFDQEARRLSGPPTIDALAPKGPATDLGGAVRRALEETGGRGVAAVIAVTDGKINRGEGAQAVVAALRRSGRNPAAIPFYALGVGDPVPPKDLEVIDVSAEPRAMLGDPIIIEASIRARGYEGQHVEAVLVMRPREGGPELELERRHLGAPPDGEAQSLTFQHAPTAAGDYVLELRLPPLDDEPVTDDNARSVSVTVSDDVSRILLVAGSPTFEYHFLKTRLVRERTANVSCWLQSAQARFPQEGDERIDALPTTIELLKDFDAIIMLDPNPEELEGAVAEALKTFVAEHKGGLLYVAGPKYTQLLLARPDLKPLRDLLPVTPGELMDRATAVEAWPLRATTDGVDHPATRLEPDPERCRFLWSRLPGLFFSYPVQGEKPGATVLVRHEDPATVGDKGARPFLVSQYFGGGPVLFMGSEETWRWRSVGARVYDRFWVGVLRFLVQGRLAGGRMRVELLTDKEEYALGEPVRLRAHAVDRSYAPLEVKELRAQARVGNELVEVTLLPAAQGRGWYEATLLPPAQGTLELSLGLPDDDPGARPATVSVAVRLPDVEFADPVLDELVLSGIAAETSGALVAPGDVALLAEKIPSLTETSRSARAPIALWDRWETIALIAALLALEWAVRKRSRMV